MYGDELYVSMVATGASLPSAMVQSCLANMAQALVEWLALNHDLHNNERYFI